MFRPALGCRYRSGAAGVRRPFAQVNLVAFYLEGKMVVSTSREKFRVRIWVVMTGTALQTMERNSPWIESLAFSPDGKIVAVACAATVELWDVATGRIVHNLVGHSNNVNSVVFSPDGKVVTSASEDEKVKLWDAATGASLQTLEGHSDYVNSVTFSPDRKVLVSASTDGSARLWDAAMGLALQTIKGLSRILPADVHPTS